MLSKRTTDSNTPDNHPERPCFCVGWQGAIVILLCLIFAASVISFSRSTSATFDEVAHLSAGYSYLKWDDYRMNPEHPPLLKKLAALPLWWNAAWPGRDALENSNALTLATSKDEQALRQAWNLSLKNGDEQWQFGRSLLYGIRSETVPPTTAPPPPTAFYNNADRLIFLARLPIFLMGLALGVLVFLWSRECFGFLGGVLSLALYCFDPNFIAHSGLVTTDIGAALFLFGSVYFLWRTCHRINALNVGLFLLFFGLAFVAKFSAVLLLPIFWLTAAVRILSPEPLATNSPPAVWRGSRVFKICFFAGLFAAALLSAYVIIWASYSFRFSAVKDPAQAAIEAQILGGVSSTNQSGGSSRAHYSELYRQLGHLPTEAAVRASAALKQLLVDQPGQEITDDKIVRLMGGVSLGPGARLMLFAQRHHVLPEAYTFGFASAEYKSHYRLSFLMGRYSMTGFGSYFFYAVLLKTPLPALALIFAGLIPFLSRRDRLNWRMLFLLLPAGLFFSMSVWSHFNIGVRHLLPMYPFLYVLAGGLAVEMERLRRPARNILVAVILCLVAVSSRFVFYPANGSFYQRIDSHYLAYFNELGGGPANGYKELVDSNLDWGQDLKNLKQWLVEHKITGPVALGYLGMADPRYYQIAYDNLPGGYGMEPQVDFRQLRPGELLIVSATNFQEVYAQPPFTEAWQQILEHSVWVDSVGYSIFIFRFEGWDDKR